jgi:hypothetical protein
MRRDRMLCITSNVEKETVENDKCKKMGKKCARWITFEVRSLPHSICNRCADPKRKQDRRQRKAQYKP